jgi:hypothetical protein
MLKTFTPITEIGDSYFTSGIVLGATGYDTSTGAMHCSTSKDDKDIYMVIYESPYTANNFDADRAYIRANTVFRIKRSQ